MRVVGWVVGELKALAEKEVAGRCIVGGVFSSELGEAVIERAELLVVLLEWKACYLPFDVRRVVKTNILLDLRSAVFNDGRADGARGRRCDEAVAQDGGDRKGK